MVPWLATHAHERPVHAVSKKLLEVTPEALAEKRRKLVEEAAAAGACGGATEAWSGRIWLRVF